jgi:hypothetical protein
MAVVEKINIDLHLLWMQRFSKELPRIMRSDNFTGRAIISFRTQPGPSLLWGGVGLQGTNITRHNDGTNAFRELDASIIRETNGASPAERDRLAEGQLT